MFGRRTGIKGLRPLRGGRAALDADPAPESAGRHGDQGRLVRSGGGEAAHPNPEDDLRWNRLNERCAQATAELLTQGVPRATTALA